MIKRFKGELLLTTAVTLLPILVGVVLWDQLPLEMATHFDANWEPNGWSSRTFTVFGLPAIIAALHVVCVFATSADPRRKNISDKLFRLVLWICPLVSWVCAAATYSYALNMDLNLPVLMSLFLAVVFVVIGNYLPKCRQNYTMGIRLPWTLASEDNWNKTHRLAGWLWMICGVLMFPVVLLGWHGVFLGLIGVMVLVPGIYSYLYYRRHGSEN